MKTRKPIIILLMSVLVVLSCFSVSAETWAYDDFTVEVPEGMMTFTPDTPISDPNWELAGISNPIETMEMYTDKDKGMNAIANFISPGGDVNVLVTRKESSDATSIHDLNLLSEEDYDAFLEKMGGSDENVTITAEKYDHPGQRFFILTVAATDTNGEEVNEVIYGTIFNGFSLAFDTYTVGGKIPEESLAAVKGIADSFVATNVLEKPAPATIEDAIPALIMLGAIVLICVGVFVMFRVMSKRDKKQKKELANKLSAYRKEHGNQGEPVGQLMFTNTTDCTNEAIHKFSTYQAYVKNIVQIAIGIALSVILVVGTIAFKMDWWLILVAVALLGYYLYKLITSSGNIERTQRRVYSRGVSQKAHYTFYTETYRVSGIQSGAVFPYFLITDVRVTKEYIYIYYGPENAYIVDRSGFAEGQSDVEFIDFIKSKAAKK